MNGLKISFAVVAFVLVQGIGVIWYVSKLDSRVDTMYAQFEKENQKEVIENQLRMKLDLESVISSVNEIKKDVKKLRDHVSNLNKKTNRLENQVERLNKRAEKSANKKKGSSIIQQSN